MTQKTLLDEFAMAALTSLVGMKYSQGIADATLAENAYEIAAVMMKERQKYETLIRGMQDIKLMIGK